ncbi:hypothetical protein [Brevundimonas sp.]|uniref:hypothetical protein n=1 Tax=Brevundimonas sp. TaxID=1871086 RepID=UPI002898C2DD|nr:hypothetical protein [Brevundimonas sp.]
MAPNRPNPRPPAIQGQTTRAYGVAAVRQRLAVGAASAASAVVTADEVLLCATTDLVFDHGPAPTAAATTGIPLKAGEKFHLQIKSGDKIAALRATADGFLLIVPVA